MTKDEKDEQKFFAERLKEGNKPMAKKHAEAGELVEPGERPGVYVPDLGNPAKAVRVGPQAVDMTGFEGEWYKQDEPPKGDPPAYEPYSRMLVPNDPYGYTVHMKNQDHYWSGTPEQAKAQFSKTTPDQESPEHKSEPAAV